MLLYKDYSNDTINVTKPRKLSVIMVVIVILTSLALSIKPDYLHKLGTNYFNNTHAVKLNGENK